MNDRKSPAPRKDERGLPAADAPSWVRDEPKPDPAPKRSDRMG